MSWVMGFLKITLIFTAFVTVIYGAGYAGAKIISDTRMRLIGVLAEIVADIYLVLIAETKTVAIGLVILYAAEVFSFLVKYKKLGSDYKKLGRIHEDIDLGWAGLFSYIIPMAFITMPELREKIPFEVEGVIGYLIAMQAVCAVYPVLLVDGIQKRIERVYHQIDCYKFISRYEIEEIAREISGNDSSEDDIRKRIEEVEELVKYFEEMKRIISIGDGDSDQMVYLEAGYYNQIHELIRSGYKNKEIINGSEILEKLRNIAKINQTLLSGIVDTVILGTVGYQKYDQYYISEAGIEKIIYALDHEYAVGKKNERKIAEDFCISMDALAELMRDQRYEVKNIMTMQEEKTDAIGAEENSEKEMVDINQCGLDELITLPSIHIILAKQLLDYRESQGGFQSVDEFIQVAQIKPHLLEKAMQRLVCGQYKSKKKKEEKSGRRVRLKGRIVEY